MHSKQSVYPNFIRWSLVLEVPCCSFGCFCFSGSVCKTELQLWLRWNSSHPWGEHPPHFSQSGPCCPLLSPRCCFLPEKRRKRAVLSLRRMLVSPRKQSCCCPDVLWPEQEAVGGVVPSAGRGRQCSQGFFRSLLDALFDLLLWNDSRFLAGGNIRNKTCVMKTLTTRWVGSSPCWTKKNSVSPQSRILMRSYISIWQSSECSFFLIEVNSMWTSWTSVFYFTLVVLYFTDVKWNTSSVMVWLTPLLSGKTLLL